MPSNISNIFLKSLIVTLVILLCFIGVSFVFRVKNKTEKLPANACFLNLNIAQFSRDEVDEFLKNQIQPQIDQLEIKLHFNGQTLNVAASDFDFHYDNNKFFNEAKKTNFAKGESFNPKMDFNKKKLLDYLKNFSQTSKTMPEAYSYRRNGETLTVSAGKDGKIFNVDENYKNIVSMFRQFQDGTIDATYDTIDSPNKKINFNEIKSKIDCEPKNAAFVRDSNGKTRVEKEQVGLILDSDEKTKIDDPNDGTYQLNLRVIKPKVTYASLKSSAYHDKSLTDVLASFTTHFAKGKDPNAIFNIKKSARAINGTVLLPGEEFSFQNAVIAEQRAHPNERYLKATQYNPSRPNGQEKAEGGGVCQTSTTTFGAALRANLTISQRCCHSKRVDYVPIGQDAAYDFGNKDLRFINNRINPIIIKAETSPTSIKVSICGKKIPSETYNVSVVSKTTSETPTAISGVATQIVKQNGAEISRRNFYSHYRIYASDNKKKATTPAPSETDPNATPTLPTVQPTQTTPSSNSNPATPSTATTSPATTQKPIIDEKTTTQPNKKIEPATNTPNSSTASNSATSSPHSTQPTTPQPSKPQTQTSEPTTTSSSPTASSTQPATPQQQPSKPQTSTTPAPTSTTSSKPSTPQTTAETPKPAAATTN